MENTLVTTLGYVLLGLIIVFFINIIYHFIGFLSRNLVSFIRWMKLISEKGKNNQKKNKTVKRIKGKRKYSSSSADGGYSFSSYSSGDSDGGGGGCD